MQRPSPVPQNRLGDPHDRLESPHRHRCCRHRPVRGRASWRRPLPPRRSGTVTPSSSSAPQFVGALGSLRIAPSKVLPGTLHQRIAFFPITGGRLDAANAKGEVPHAGGLTLTRGSTQVVITDFIIDTTSAPKLTGIVTANGSIVGRIPLFNLALPQLVLPLQLPPGPETLLIEGNRVTLTAEAATALNGAFGTTAFTPGFYIGIASVYANY